jgi:hypothetical protein
MRRHHAIRSQQEMLARLRLRCPRHLDVTARTMLDLVMQRARAGAVPYAAYTAAHGIRHALETGLCFPAVARAIEAMAPDELLALVAEVAVSCETIGAVPRYLTTRGGPELDACA